METYRIEMTKDELQNIIAALNIYDTKLFEYLGKQRFKKHWETIKKRREDTIDLLEKLDIINNPPF